MKWKTLDVSWLTRCVTVVTFLGMMIPTYAKSESNEGMRIANAVDYANRYPGQTLCPGQMREAYLASGLPRGQGAETVRAIGRIVERRLRYKKDNLALSRRGGDWDNFAAQVIAGERIQGDCEDLAITVATLSVCAGVPAEDVGIALISKGRSDANLSKVDHTVGVYLRDRRMSVVADTMDRHMRWRSTEFVAVLTARDLAKPVPIARPTAK